MQALHPFHLRRHLFPSIHNSSSCQIWHYKADSITLCFSATHIQLIIILTNFKGLFLLLQWQLFRQNSTLFCKICVYIITFTPLLLSVLRNPKKIFDKGNNCKFLHFAFLILKIVLFFFQGGGANTQRGMMQDMGTADHILTGWQ